MKIIKLGDFTFRFICPKCHTEFEIETKELTYLPQCYKYTTYCPLCDEAIFMKDNFETADGYNVIKLIKKREELNKNE